MSQFTFTNCNIKVNGVDSLEDAKNALQEMLDSFDELTETNASIIISNPDWKKNVSLK